ncbi:MAG: hypothetical protein GY927_05420, partial [bacterium]|nr:hypothetical protein [bacterium]
MSWRHGLILFLLMVTALGGYWLYTHVPLFALAVMDGQQWNVLAQGWKVFYQGWFFVVPSLVVASLMAITLVIWAYNWAEKVDHERELAHQRRDFDFHIIGLQERANNAEKRAESAESKANARYASAMAEAKKQTLKADAEIKKGRSMQAKAIEHTKQSLQEVEEASQKARRATKKKNNAMAAAERIK